MSKKLCENCKSEISLTDKFCKDCGTEIPDEIKLRAELKDKIKETPVEKAPKKSNKKKATVFFSILLLIGALIPTNVSISYQKTENYQEPYTDKEAYEVQVPYNDEEYYTEKEPYTVTYTEPEPFTDTRNIQKQLIYKVDFTECSGRVPLVKDAKVTIKVTNLDSVGDTFSFKPMLILPDGSKIGSVKTNYIYPQQSSDFSYTSNSEINTCTYETISIPTKTISESFTNYRDIQKSKTEYRDVQKSRTVVKYRTETQYKDVTKYRTSQRNVTDFKQKTVLMIQRIFGWY